MQQQKRSFQAPAASRVWCDSCTLWVANNPKARRAHFDGNRHKYALLDRAREDRRAERRDGPDSATALREIRRAAERANVAVEDVLGASGSSSSSSSEKQQRQRQQQRQHQQPQRQSAQLSRPGGGGPVPRGGPDQADDVGLRRTAGDASGLAANDAPVRVLSPEEELRVMRERLRRGEYNPFGAWEATSSAAPAPAAPAPAAAGAASEDLASADGQPVAAAEESDRLDLDAGERRDEASRRGGAPTSTTTAAPTSSSSVPVSVAKVELKTKRLADVLSSDSDSESDDKKRRISAVGPVFKRRKSRK